MKKKILLAEDISEMSDEFNKALSLHYEIDLARSVQSSMNLIAEKAGDYDLFVLDANLPDEDDGQAINSKSWNCIYDAIVLKLGEDAKRKIVINTAKKLDKLIKYIDVSNIISAIIQIIIITSIIFDILSLMSSLFIMIIYYNLFN